MLSFSSKASSSLYLRKIRRVGIIRVATSERVFRRKRQVERKGSFRRLRWTDWQHRRSGKVTDKRSSDFFLIVSTTANFLSNYRNFLFSFHITRVRKYNYQRSNVDVRFEKRYILLQSVLATLELRILLDEFLLHVQRLAQLASELLQASGTFWPTVRYHQLRYSIFGEATNYRSWQSD